MTRGLVTGGLVTGGLDTGELVMRGLEGLAVDDGLATTVGELAGELGSISR